MEKIRLILFAISNYPNPFSTTTTIKYSGNPLKNGTVEIFNLSGILIESLPITENEIEWNSGENKPGIYFYRIKTDTYISNTQTMIKTY